MDLAEQERLNIVASSIQKILDNLDSPMQLAIIGKISSSKSTLVNAILGSDDIVEMGQMETTFNVCWLKYGSSKADVKVVFKNGSTNAVPRDHWKEWSGQAENKLKDTVKYIEVTYEHEILRNINIIDTPGLDSSMGTDSKNTIDFLKDVRPDAVLMVFTKGLAQSTMEVIKEFQGSQANKLLLSPLNAMGILSKIDLLWSVGKPKLPFDMAQHDVIESNIYYLFPEVRDSLYSIMPVCAKLGLASQMMTQHDFELLKSLSRTKKEDLDEMFHSVNDFTDDYFKTKITINERCYLHDKFGLYGVYELISFINNSECDLQSAKIHLQEISGFYRFNKNLYSHFGQRSYLIKTQSVQHFIVQACNEQRQMIKTEEGKDAVDKIQEKILATLMGVFEYKQLDFLSKIYERSMNITDNNAIEEYKRVCGEYGNSVVSRLNINKNESISIMAEEAAKRAQIANKKATMNQMRAPQDAELYKMLSLSYANLSKRIFEMQQQREEAEKIIKITNEFIYGE
jgi:hypothetical protein